MPIITVRAIQGYFSREQQTDLIRELTAAVVRVADHPAIESATRVIIVEIPDGQWGVAGEVLTLTQLLERLGGSAETTPSADDDRPEVT